MRQQDEHRLFLSVVTLGELHKGIARLAPGHRRSELEEWLERDLVVRFHRRVLDVDPRVARKWGLMLAQAEARGLPAPVVDALIAATARVHGCAVVTRNTSDFDRFDVAIVNPWERQADHGTS
jgi:predicted nucleic acid-binding protein